MGTTLAVAEGLNRNAIGFELNQKYIDYFEDHIRPNVVKEMKTEQQKFFDTKRETQRLIWTLRIHKYAFKLYWQLMDDLGLEGADDGVNTILTITDPNSIVSANGANPTGVIVFVRDNSLSIDESDLTDAAESLMSDVRGSGDYYELDHELRVRTIDEVINELREGKSCLPDNGTLYLYKAGVHNDSHREITPREWIAKAGSQDWNLRRSKGWPPLLSNLQISVKDPMGKKKNENEEDANQSEMSTFSSRP